MQDMSNFEERCLHRFSQIFTITFEIEYLGILSLYVKVTQHNLINESKFFTNIRGYGIFINHNACCLIS